MTADQTPVERVATTVLDVLLDNGHGGVGMCDPDSPLDLVSAHVAQALAAEGLLTDAATERDWTDDREAARVMASLRTPDDQDAPAMAEIPRPRELCSHPTCGLYADHAGDHETFEQGVCPVTGSTCHTVRREPPAATVTDAAKSDGVPCGVSEPHDDHEDVGGRCPGTPPAATEPCGYPEHRHEGWPEDENGDITPVGCTVCSGASDLRPPAATVTEGDETGYRVAVDATTGAVSVEPWSPTTVTEDERAALATWPCDDYRAPLTCFTTPKPKTLTCEGCRAAFPDGEDVRALYGEAAAGVVAPLLAATTARADDLARRLDEVQTIHGRYFDLDLNPGNAYSTPEPEDVWRYDRDLRAALTPSPAPDTDGGDHDA